MQSGSIIDVACHLILQSHPKFQMLGYRFLEAGGKELYLIRGKVGEKTLRFAFGTDYPTPEKISTTKRKSLGVRYSPKKRRRKKS